MSGSDVLKLLSKKDRLTIEEMAKELDRTKENVSNDLTRLVYQDYVTFENILCKKRVYFIKEKWKLLRRRVNKK